MKNSFTRIGILVWPHSVKLLIKSEFQNKIKELLLDLLLCEDDYIEISQMVQKFSKLIIVF